MDHSSDLISFKGWGGTAKRFRSSRQKYHKFVLYDELELGQQHILVPIENLNIVCTGTNFDKCWHMGRTSNYAHF